MLTDVRELDLAMCFPIFEWKQDEKPLDHSEEVLLRDRQEPYETFRNHDQKTPKERQGCTRKQRT